MRVLKTIAAISVFLMIGCSSMFHLNDEQMKEFSTGNVGDCETTEITVSNYTPSKIGSYCGTWTADCKGKKYLCNRQPAGGQAGVVKCTPKS